MRIGIMSLAPVLFSIAAALPTHSSFSDSIDIGGCSASARSLSGTMATRKKCWVLGDPPYIKHGKFRSVEFMRYYPLTPTFFKGSEPPRSFDALLPMLNKLASGGRVDIVLIGG